MDFVNNLKRKAKEFRKTIVLPESVDKRTIEAANIIVKDDFADIILIGDENEIAKKIDNPDKVQIIDPKNSDLTNKYVEMFIKLRKHKGMNEHKARNLLLNDPLYFGAALVRDDKADGMVAGAINATADVIRAGLQIIGTAENTKIVSSFFVIIVPNCNFGLGYGSSGIFLFSDCGLIQDPSDEELAQIAISSAKSFRQLMREEPKVALLSHSTYGSAEHPKIEKVLRALAIAKNQDPDLQIDGELQLDAAIVPEIGKSKAPDSKIAGNANVLIFPDIDAGNIGYKLVQRLAKAEAYGPITQGMTKPINDLSRGCNSKDIVGAVAITAIQATK
ncbi:phosphate acetyltransferase [Helicobacter sp. 16-1353]|uniref:phosphate acetyltransferase n=1 Tax=Helicobacter sp. 16-1353 TaxID=2004996 RepID=UPI000DCBD960|nr:phosphate acetyltransferase [Helicobacter sp. 16-1353]RAX54418.1 phosphate acetyltransferase [Helicobacter sp. 16-1353]